MVNVIEVEFIEGNVLVSFSDRTSTLISAELLAELIRATPELQFVPTPPATARSVILG